MQDWSRQKQSKQKSLKATPVLQAYEERQRNKNFKVIERSKLEARIKEYVRDLIHRHHNRKNGRV